MMNNDEQSPEQSRISPNNDEQEGDVVESPGCDDVGVMCRDGDGVGGYGRDSDYIPFLGDGVGLWGMCRGSWDRKSWL